MNIDCAWRSRATTFYQGAEAAAIIARASCDGQAMPIKAARRQRKRVLEAA